MSPARAISRLILWSAGATMLLAQGLPVGGDQLLEYVYESAAERSFERDDHRELHLQGGFRFQVPRLQLSLRGENALLLFDLTEVRRAAQRGQGGELPTRGLPPPTPRRQISADEMRARVERSLRAVSGTTATPTAGATTRIQDLFRFFYCEGGVIAVKEDVEVLRCERLWISPLDDRIVVEDAELRYVTPTRRGPQTLVVRGPRLIKEGGRWTGHDLVLTTCTAAEPHYALAVDEAEIIERDGEFEVVVRGQSLQIGGTSLVPLPNARFFTGSQSEFPVRRASGGYSGQLGAQGEVAIGTQWNGVGGTLHRWLTGRPEEEFRGEWEFGVGWIQQRGVPLDGVLTYRAANLYTGRTEGFWIDDQGTNIREIRNDFAGQPIGGGKRGVLRSENRLFLGQKTHLDLVAFHASDPGVFPEFFPSAYRNEEVPETSAYLHHADGNRLLTIGARFNLSRFSYADDRSLAEKFVEELPVMTWQWLAQPIAETPWETPIVLDLETELGQRRSNYDDLAATRVSDRTFRADQLAEVSAPFHLGALYVRPFFSGRGTFYDGDSEGNSQGRIALEAGFQVGTRMSRTWSWVDDGQQRGMRHVIAPRITYRNRFHVDDSPGEFVVFDQLDQLTELELVRVEVRNLLQRMVPTASGPLPRDFVFLDLAQDFFPDAERDNRGDTLGLFYYDLLIRPDLPWMPLDQFALAVYGDLEWQRGIRTFDTEVQFGKVLGCSWTIEYRRDSLAQGAVGIAASTRLMDRWTMFAGSQRDLDRDEWLFYSFGLRRDDHDWSIEMSAVYNPFSDETTFRIDFVPRLGGLNQPRRDRFSGVDGQDRFQFAY